MHRDMGQPSLAESLLPTWTQRAPGTDCRAFDWDRKSPLRSGRETQLPSADKVLLLEQWYNLSDPQMEEALQVFVGLGLHPTISRFRATLEELGISETFKEPNWTSGDWS